MPTHFDYLPLNLQTELKCIAETLVTDGKGILCADESVSKMGKRLEEIGLTNSEDIRKQWRQLLFSTDPVISDSIAGVILSPETLYQKDENDKRLVELLKDRCIIPGIKVDTGLVNLPQSEDEVTTQGLDDLETRLAQYKLDGCEFARWRCQFKIGKNSPSYRALMTNADALARYASLCQSQKICPIIEPEVVIPDGDHDIIRCQKVTETVLSFVYKALNDHHVFLEGTILKPNMVTAGLSQTRADPSDVALATLTTLQRTVPLAVPGICFSSSGQTELEATINLNAINQEEGQKAWKLTFAFGRALQVSALRIWSGKKDQVKKAQDEFIKRARANGDASLGKYSSESDYDANESILTSPSTPSTPSSPSTDSSSPSTESTESDSDK